MIVSQLESVRLRYSEIRAAIANRPLRPFAFVEIVPKPRREAAIADGSALLADGWSLPDAKLDSLKTPINWEGHPRSFEFHLHAWAPVQRLLVAFDASQNAAYFDAAESLARDWMRACPIKPVGRPLAASLADVLASTANGSWWYDMAVAQRLQRLSYICDVVCRKSEVPDADVAPLMDHILLHHAALMDDHIYRPGTNHGFFQALNQVAACARFPEFDVDGLIAKTAAERLRVMTAKQYTAGGAHAEHSPGYHYMVTVSLMNARRANVIDDLMHDRLQQFEVVLGWMVTPSGHLALFGDTDPRAMYTRDDRAFFEHPQLLATLTKSAMTPTGVTTFEGSGYAFARLYAPDVAREPPNASYLAQMAGFHSRVHKHADHLSFIWHDKNRAILIDPARYAYAGKTVPGTPLFEDGFWYGDPKRIYCETTRAHNCLEIDGRNYRRNKAKPFGSALLSATEQDGLAVTDCEVTHVGNVRHRRHLIMAPGHFLLVLDWVYDRSRDPHEYRQWFHFDNPWHLEVDGELIRARHAGGEGTEPAVITAASLLPGRAISPIVRGQETPELLGWQSDKPYSLVPSSCFNFGAKATEPTIFATLFTFGDTLIRREGATRFNATMKIGRACWGDEKGEHVVEIDRSENDRLAVRKTSKVP